MTLFTLEHFMFFGIGWLCCSLFNALCGLARKAAEIVNDEDL